MAALMVGGACAAQAPRPDWPPGPTVVDVELDDYQFRYEPRVPSGRAVFRVRNVGAVEHELQLFPLDDDVPPIEVQLHGSERRVATPLGGVPHRRPGQTGTFAADLRPGRRYALLCFLRDDTGTHALRGMATEFRTVDPGAASVD